MDKVDIHIVKELVKDASQSNREIGEALYISPQAVSQRIRKLKEDKIIDKYTITLNPSKQFSNIYMEVYLDDNNFLDFERFICKESNILSCEKIHGSYCYLIKYLKEDEQEYNNFVLNIEKYARYKINEVSKRIV